MAAAARARPRQLRRTRDAQGRSAGAAITGGPRPAPIGRDGGRGGARERFPRPGVTETGEFTLNPGALIPNPANSPQTRGIHSKCMCFIPNPWDLPQTRQADWALETESSCCKLLKIVGTVIIIIIIIANTIILQSIKLLYVAISVCHFYICIIYL